MIVPSNNQYGHTPMELGNLRFRENLQRPLDIECRSKETFRRENIPRGRGAGTYGGEQRRCYNCGKICHIAAYCRSRIPPKWNKPVYRRPLHHLEVGETEEEEVQGNEDNQ